VIPAFVLFLLCFAPQLVLGFPTGLYSVGFEGRIGYTSLCQREAASPPQNLRVAE